MSVRFRPGIILYFVRSQSLAACDVRGEYTHVRIFRVYTDYRMGHFYAVFRILTIYTQKRIFVGEVNHGLRIKNTNAARG
jgi:hypothetical protein